MKNTQKRPASRSKRSSSAAPVEIERRALALPRRVILDADRALFKLREENQRVSFSALVEVALLELLDRNDLGTILTRYGASARRH